MSMRVPWLTPLRNSSNAMARASIVFARLRIERPLGYYRNPNMIAEPLSRYKEATSSQASQAKPRIFFGGALAPRVHVNDRTLVQVRSPQYDFERALAERLLHQKTPTMKLGTEATVELIGAPPAKDRQQVAVIIRPHSLRRLRAR